MKTFDELFAELTSKVAAGDTNSGTVAAISQGIHTVGKKVVEEAAEAENIMSVLMGDDVESRKAFIQKNARDVRNLDF